MSSPYTPPTAPVRDLEPRRGSPILGVVLGILVDLGGSLLAGLLLTVAYAATLAQDGVNEEQIVGAMTSLSPYSWFGVAGMILGLLSSLLGGLVCALVARRAQYKLGAIVALVSVACGLLVGGQHYSAGLNIIMVVATVALVFVGVRLAIVLSAE
jgi:hypothetical protein